MQIWYLNVTHHLLIPTVSFLEIFFFNRVVWHFEKNAYWFLYQDSASLNSQLAYHQHLNPEEKVAWFGTNATNQVT